MSILDTIMSLFSNKSEEAEVKTAPAAEASTPKETIKTEVKPEPVVTKPAEQKEVLKPVVERTPVVKSTPTAKVQSTKLQIPEDSTLKRHFLAKLKAEIEASMQARPTDVTLKRHYDATVQSELDSLIG